MSILIKIDDQEIEIDKFLGVLQREFGREIIAEGDFSLLELNKYRNSLIEAVEQLMINDLSNREQRILNEIQEQRNQLEINLFNKLNEEQQQLYNKLFTINRFEDADDEKLPTEQEPGLEEFLDDLLEDLSDEEINLIEPTESNSQISDSQDKQATDENKVVYINEYRNR